MNLEKSDTLLKIPSKGAHWYRLPPWWRMKRNRKLNLFHPNPSSRLLKCISVGRGAAVDEGSGNDDRRLKFAGIYARPAVLLTFDRAAGFV